MEMSTAERLLYTSIRLVTFTNGVATSTGTGFFYQVDLGNGKIAPVIITNNHVIKGSDRVDLICHQQGKAPSEPSGEFVNLQMNLVQAYIVRHPDADIDLCAIPIANLLEIANAGGKPVLFITLQRSNIPPEADWQFFDAIEEVTMIGCPNGIYDEVNKMPLTRRGITATSLSKNYEGKAHFMVDMACYPGSSGSPIYIYNPIGYLDRKTNQYRLDQGRLHLVGILFSGPTINNSGQIVLGQVPSVLVKSMMHLGVAVKATEIFALEDELKKRVASGM